jgi:hypothetical protein
VKNRLLFWRVLLGVAVGAWLVARVGRWGPGQAAAGSVLAGLLPGLALLRLLGLHRRSRLWSLVAAGALSPPLLGAAIGATAWTRWPVDALGLLWLALSAVALLWPARRVDPGNEPPFVPESAQAAPADRGVLLLGLVTAAVVAFGLLNPRIRQWSDGWFHAAVLNVVALGGVPPDFPHFAGQPLPYPWLVHADLAGLRQVVSADPFVLIGALNVWSAFLLPAAVYVLARALGAASGAARWSAFAAVLGVNPLGPLWMLGRVLVGQTAGWAVVRDLTSNASTIQTGLALDFPFFQSSLLARWWTPTAFNLAVVLTALALAALAEVWRRPRPRNALLLAFALCLLLQWHTLTALALGAAIAAGVLVASLELARRDRASAGIRVMVLAAVGAVACLAAWPYLRMVTLSATGTELMHWRLSRPNLWGLALSMGPVALAGLAGARRLADDGRVLFAGLFLGLVVPFLAFDLPGPAEEKIYFPLFVLLAAASGPALAALVHRGALGRGLVGACTLSALVAAGVTTWAFATDHRPLRSLFTADLPPGVELFTRDEDAALRWIRERSPHDAVFLQAPRPFSNEPILVYGARRLFLGPAEFFYRATFFEGPGRPPVPLPLWNELKRREALQAAVLSPRPLASDSVALLRAYRWPLYVWQDAALGGGVVSPTLLEGDSLARVAFATPTVRVLALFPDPRPR